MVLNLKSMNKLRALLQVQTSILKDAISLPKIMPNYQEV